VFAKPSDVEHGVRYALGSLLLSGPPYLLVAGKSWRRLPRAQRAIVAASAVHWLTLAGAGGDWMPFWRLAMPALPGVLLVGAALLGATSSRLWAARLLPAFLACGLLHWAQGAGARSVRAERANLIAELPPLLADAERVATVDVGWVGAAGGFEVIDLAGVTDPEVAYLAGGHTSKRLPTDFLERRRVQALVLLTEGADEAFEREVERRVSTLRGADQFATVGSIPLGDRRAYRVLRRRPDAEEPR
jgi:hypothetical protein